MERMTKDNAINILGLERTYHHLLLFLIKIIEYPGIKVKSNYAI